MDISELSRIATQEFSDMRSIANFLFIFSSALVVIIGIIAFLEVLANIADDEVGSGAVKRTLVILLYSAILMISGIFWLNLFWQTTTGNVLLFYFSIPDVHCFLFACG
jgi:hypothetical protein